MLLLRSVLDPFDVKTVFDHTGKGMSLYPRVVYCGQQHFRSHIEQFADTRMVTMQLPCNLQNFFNESMLKLLIINTTKLNYR
jgi:hypothetical protein